MPVSVSYKGASGDTVRATFDVSEIKVESSIKIESPTKPEDTTYMVTLVLTATKTSEEENTYNSINYKFYDSNNVILSSGTFFGGTGKTAKGDKIQMIFLQFKDK